MGSLQLECPLCCSETFTSRDSLKYHLLSIIDNLLCPVCGERFEKIFDLADHLGSKCSKTSTKSTIKIEKMEVEDIEDSISTTVLEKSILAKALMQKPIEKEQSISIVETEEEEASGSQEVELVFTNENGEPVSNNDENNKEKVNETEEEMFYCSSCMVSFSSVDTHLQEYHEGQTVFIEDGQNGDEQGDGNEETSFYVVQGNEEENEDSNDSELQTGNLGDNTIQEEDCVDKDGRLYTRKVVQIEKFWDDKETGKAAPITLQYVLENGKAKKADDNDLENLADNQKLLIIYQCPNCSIHFSKLEQYNKHKCSKASNTYKCTKCDSSFNTIKSVNAHMKLHKTEKTVGNLQTDNHGPHICDTCNTEFPSYKSLRLHRRMHDPIKEKEIEPPVSYGIMGEDILPNDDSRVMFVCEICNNSYDKQYEEVHMKSHVDEEKYDCRICNRKFFTQTNLEMHVRVHSNGKKFCCSQCKKNFLTYETLQEHITNQCNTNSKMYECQYCGRRFVRPHEKVKHERIHTGEKPHVCGICGKAFRVSYCLTLHMRTHSGTRPYQCNTCGKRFKAHSVYNHHLLTHSNERNYKCPYCPKSFKTGVQLAGHKNSHIKPFTCKICNRPFASLYAVRAHMESHYRENNLKYNCSECGASYARAFALRDHIKAHHPTLESKDEIMLSEYEMVTEGINASTTILPVDESVLVQYEQTTDKVELVEEVSTEVC